MVFENYSFLLQYFLPIRMSLYNNEHSSIIYARTSIPREMQQRAFLINATTSILDKCNNIHPIITFIYLYTLLLSQTILNNSVDLFANAVPIRGSQFVTSIESSYDQQDVDADEGLRYEWILAFLLRTKHDNGMFCVISVCMYLYLCFKLLWIKCLALNLSPL